MEFEIKEGVPWPVGKGKPSKYDLPLEKMKGGDHIMIELPKSKIRQEIKIIRNYCLRYTQKNPDAKFRVLSREEGVGVWRI